MSVTAEALTMATEPEAEMRPALNLPVAPDADERFARLRLARSRNVGPRTYFHLLNRFGSAERALDAMPDLAARGGTANYEVCPVELAAAEMAAGERTGAVLLQSGDPDYPPMLAAIDPAPPVLWVMGDVAIFQKRAIAIVGARNASALGGRTARRLARELAATGRIIVSGLARGIDTAAHEASLGTGTIAVLPGGLDEIYPPENVALAERIAKDGALVSEVPFGTMPTSRHFPRRNRLISGLAEGVVLVEAAARSGSLITARFALEQGREAMACPGAPEDPRAAGCNQMIREGGALVRHAGDIEEALAAPQARGFAEGGESYHFDADLFGEESMRDDYDALADFDEDGRDTDEVLAEQILELLGPTPVEVDEVARLCGASPGELSLAILELDLAGRIEILPGGMIAALPED